MTTPRTALWVTPVSNLAGVARHVLDATAHGVPGWRIVVACPPGPLLDELGRRGVEAHAVPLDGAAPTAVRELRRVITRVKPQVVHGHLARADLLAAAANAGLPPKLISTEHGIAANARLYNKQALAATVKRAMHWARCQMTDAIIGVSESTASLVRSTWHPRARVVVVLNGVDRPAERQTVPGHRFLSLSRLAHEKNIDKVLDAFAIVTQKLPGASLTVAGDGPLLDALRAHAIELGLGDRVTFPGHVDGTRALTEHDVVVQLSAWENASYTLLDAAAHGLGVVATPVGGNPEFLPEQCLVTASDRDAVAAAMLEQSGDVDRRPTLPESWPTIDQMCAGIAEVYQEVCR